MSTVLVRNATEETLSQVMDEVFDLFHPHLWGKKVFIKPNMVAPMATEKGVTTHPAVVKALLDKVLTYTEDVSVGDNSMFDDDKRLNDTITKTGIGAAVGRHWANPANDVETISIGSEVVDEVPVARIFRESDFIIFVPKFKTHLLTGVSGCIKNVFGVMPGLSKSEMHFRLSHPKMLTRFLVDLYRFISPHLHIVDALVGMEGNGPSHGKLREVNKIIAGTNGVEVDGVMAAMMGFDPSRLKFLEMANNLGLGETDLKKIDIVGDFEILPDFKPPLTYITTKVRVELDEEICTQCGTCEEVCHAGAMRLDPYPTIDNQKCIYCFCCSEGCPEGALKYYAG